MVSALTTAGSRVEIHPLPPVVDEFTTRGGEAFVYVHPSDSRLLVKVYHENNVVVPRRGADAHHLLDLAEFRDGLTPSQGLRLSESFSWPLQLCGKSHDEIEGMVIRRAPDEFMISYETEYGMQTKAQGLMYLNDAYFSRPMYAGFNVPFQNVDFEDRVELACEYLHTMKVLWGLGFRYCDYSENNLLWSIVPRPRVFIIDVESCQRAGVSGGRSNGWYPRSALGNGIEADRSICARLIWRVLVGDTNAVPPRAATSTFLHLVRPETASMIKDFDLTGDESLVDGILDELKSYRSTENEKKAFEWATGTRFARVILDYAPLNPTPKQQVVIENAKKQLAIEEHLLSLEPSIRSYRAARTVPLPGFELDIAVFELSSSGGFTREVLRQMAMDGEFEEIANQFVAGASPEAWGLLAERSIQFALAQLGPPNLLESRGAGSSASRRFDWSWPGASFVNCSRIQVLGTKGNVIAERVIRRDVDNPGFQLRSAMDLPDEFLIRVSFGMTVDVGEHVFCPLWAEKSIKGFHRSKASGSKGRAGESHEDLVRVDPRTWQPISARPPMSARPGGPFAGSGPSPRTVAGGPLKSHRASFMRRMRSRVRRLLGLTRRR